MAKKVIVVDDDALLAKTISICLSRRGYEVKVFYSGVDTIGWLVEEKPDLLVLDIRLPDCDGWFIAKLLKRIRLGEEVPLIVISALEPDRAKVLEIKPYAYIQKPFYMEQLMKTVEKSLSGEKNLASV